MPASYPSAIKTFTQLVDGVDDVLALHPNERGDEITAIETELGTNPRGSATDVKTRLDASQNADGTIKNDHITTPRLADGAVTLAKIAAAVLKIVNIYQAETSSPTNIGTGWTDIGGLSLGVTPQATTSKFFVIATIGTACQGAGCGSSGEHGFRLLRDGSELDKKVYDEGGAEGRSSMAPCCLIYRDSPGTTSSITFKVQGIAGNAGIYAAPGNGTQIGQQSKAVLIVIEYRDT